MFSTEKNFFVLEGNDACGKTTQFNLLQESLRDRGYEVHCLDLPQYESESSYFIRRYLSGEYGSLEEVPAEVASLFFTMERYDLKLEIIDALDQGKIVLANRFTASNLAFQGAKLPPEERQDFFDNLTKSEFETFAIPRPRLNLILSLSLKTNLRLLDERHLKQKGKKQKNKTDIHESNKKYLGQVHSVYEDLISHFPSEFVLINCEKRGRLLSREAISKLIWQTLSAELEKDS